MGSVLCGDEESSTESIHDAGTPDVIYHVVQVSVWEKAEAEGNTCESCFAR